MTDAAVKMMFSNNGSINLGADIGVAVGPLGRTLEGNVGASTGSMAPIYSLLSVQGLVCWCIFRWKGHCYSP
jgi:lipid-binding SYLF domain-containing protein